MDYFKDMMGVEKITKEHEKVVDGVYLSKVLSDYIDMGYTEFKLEYNGTKGMDKHQGREYKVVARGDKEKIVKKVRQWYPDLLNE